jgi:hypothetical protein
MEFIVTSTGIYRFFKNNTRMLKNHVAGTSAV